MTLPRFVLLLICLFLVYTQGLWERMFDQSPVIKVVLEFSIWSYLLLSIKYFKKQAPAKFLFILYLIISLAAAILNGSAVIAWLKYIRYFGYFYLIFITLWNTPISQNQWRIIFNFSAFLILLQGLGAAYNIFLIDQRIEGYVGLMSSLGGTTAATFPLLIINLSAFLYLFMRYNSHRFNLILLFFVISAVLVSYSSGKRAIFFSVPLFMFVTIIVSAINIEGNKKFYRHLLILFTIILVSIPVYFYGIKTTRGVNYYLSGNETNKQLFESALEYAKSYETGTSRQGLAIGRTGSTIQIIRNSTISIGSFLFGQGYGRVKDEDTIERLGVSYGIVGITRDIISAGWLVMFLTVSIMIKVIMANRSIKSTVTKVIRIIILLVFLFTHIAYSSDFVVSLKISFMLLLISAFINSPLHCENLDAILDKYFYSSTYSK